MFPLIAWRDTAIVLESAGGQYGQAVAAFTEQAKGELAVFMERESARTIEKQEMSVRKIMRKALLLEIEGAKSMPLKKPFVHLLVHGTTALSSSLLTFVLLRVI